MEQGNLGEIDDDYRTMAFDDGGLFCRRDCCWLSGVCADTGRLKMEHTKEPCKHWKLGMIDDWDNCQYCKAIADEKEYDELKQQRDELQQQLAGMTDSAKHFSGGMEYYRDLIDEAAKSIGIAMYTADDQGVHPEPLRAKLPECVAELVQQCDEYKKDAERYRWLRDKSVMYESEDGGDSVWCVSGTSHQDCRPCEDDELDAAIDAAIAKEQK